MRRDISSDPTEILRSQRLEVVPYAPRVAALSECLGIDLSATLFALTNLPLCQERDTHAAVRRAAARLISERTETLRAAIPDMVRTHCAVLCVPGRVDLMQEVIGPLVSDTISILIDMPIDVAEHDHISRVFSQALGVAKRRKMDHALGQLTTRLRQTFSNADESVVGLKLAFTILGRDAMLGTFGCTLHDLVQKVDGGAWSALDWPDTPTRTGVPYIDRIALEDVTVGGEALEAGSNIRARLADYETAEDPRSRIGFFGAGAHVCLGRALTLDLWRGISRFMAQSTARPHVLEFALRRDDVFHIPQILFLEIEAP